MFREERIAQQREIKSEYQHLMRLLPELDEVERYDATRVNDDTDEPDGVRPLPLVPKDRTPVVPKEKAY